MLRLSNPPPPPPGKIEQKRKKERASNRLEERKPSPKFPVSRFLREVPFAPNCLTFFLFWRWRVRSDGRRDAAVTSSLFLPLLPLLLSFPFPFPLDASLRLRLSGLLLPSVGRSGERASVVLLRRCRRRPSVCRRRSAPSLVSPS
jgi:hypothetical protein